MKPSSAWLAAIVFIATSYPCRAEDDLPPILRAVRFDQKLNNLVPLELVFNDEVGRACRLREFFHDKPVILVLAYYRCPKLCTEVLNGLVASLHDIPSLTAGKDFQVVVVSFDPRETAELAAAKKKSYVDYYERPGTENGWHFLTGPEASIDLLTQAVGFRYAYDPKNDQFAHASGICMLTPKGRVARYFFGIRFPPRDVRLGLVEASENKIGSAIDQVLLFCFHYDPTTGQYSAAVMNLVRAGGAITLLALGGFWLTVRRRGRRVSAVDQRQPGEPKALSAGDATS